MEKLWKCMRTFIQKTLSAQRAARVSLFLHRYKSALRTPLGQKLYLDTNLTVFGEDLKRSRMTNLLSSGDLAYNHVRLLPSFAPLQRAAVPAGLLEQV